MAKASASGRRRPGGALSPFRALPARPSVLVERIAQRRRDAPAMIDGLTGRAAALSELLARAERRAAELAACGVQAGETVVVPGLLDSAAVVDVLAVWLCDAAVLPAEPAATEWEMQRRHESARAGWAIAAAGAAPVPLARREPSMRGADGRALCLTTSGTSGPPKTIGLTAANLAAAAAQMADRLGTGPDEIILSGLPIFHTAGFVLQLTSGLLGGWTQVALPRFDAAAAWELIAAHRVTHTHVAPRMLELLTAADPGSAAATLRFVSCGSAALPLAAGQRFEQLTGVPVLRGYGMSETGATAHHVAPGETGGGMDVGTAVLGAHTRIVGADGVMLPAGEVGEVLLRGPQVALRYVDGSGSGDGWLHTGDLGALDEAGRLTIAGRLKDVVKYNGHQVFPSELEEIVRAHPAVRDAVVFGRPDRSAGEIPVARVVLSAPLSEQELIAYVGSRVAPYRRIRAVEVVDVIERGAMGKARPARSGDVTADSGPERSEPSPT